MTRGKVSESRLAKTAWALAALVFIMLTAYVAYRAGRPHPTETISLDFSASGLDFDRIRQNAQAIASRADRLTGYAGNDAAFDYIRRQVAAMGVPQQDTAIQEFPVAFPHVQGAELVFASGKKSASIPCFPISREPAARPRKESPAISWTWARAATASCAARRFAATSP